tara:strand:+ start:142013 stop:142861 length:849 start_codon:yes stop_codon:yes gene_type:complete
MVQFNLEEVFIIKIYTLKEWVKDFEDRNYLEIIFIEKGRGMHRINNVDIAYKAKDIFLIAPDDNHYFNIESETTFCTFLFTNSLFSSKVNLPDRSYWLRRIDFILQHPNLKPGDVIRNNVERDLIWQIHSLIHKENDRKEEYYRHIISNMVSTTLSIIARNINEGYKQYDLPQKDKHQLIDDILAYIHKYVYESQRMKISALASNFNMTNSTLSNYFKKQTGKSLHHYILLHKLDMVKYRLEHTDFTVSEIAYQLGFTDESHLTRIFKKYFETTPKGYKNSL